jgi:large subunit ribosomal protein L2
MGKRIIMQRRGRATSTYRVKKKAFSKKLQIPPRISGEGEVVRIVNSAAHTCPVAKILWEKGTFYIPAFKNMYLGEKISFGKGEIKQGSIMELKDIPLKTKIYSIESKPNDGGKYIKAGGMSATISRVVGENVFVVMPSKKEKKFKGNSRAVIGVVAGAGRVDKPILKAGKQFHIKKSKSKLWPRTSAVKMNAIDHPFGSGRGKNPKPKIAKRNAPKGARVGLIRPRQTGKRK